MDLLDSLGSVYTYDRDLWGAPNGPTGAYPGHSSTYGVEIRKQADGRISLNPTNLKHLDITALSTWLKKPVAPSNSGDIAGVKLLLLEAANAQFGIALGPSQRLAMRNALEEAMRVFEIPSVALAHLVSWVPGFLRLRKGAANKTIAQDDVTTYCLFQLSLGFAWTHSPTQHLTQGIIWYEEAVNPRSRILRDLEDLKVYLEQPMYLALCSCAMAERRIMFERRDLISRVQLVDSKIGTNAGYEFLGKDPWAEQNVKIGELSQLVSEVSSLTVRLRYRMRAVGDLSAELVKENLKSWFRADTATEDTHPELCSQADRIDEMLQRINSFATRILDHAVGLQERSSSQMTQVSNSSIMNVLAIGLLKTKQSQLIHAILQVANLISQQNQRNSHLVALEGKRDSSSMKTIAAVTMVFLPGTFVASFFATPFFHWDASKYSLILQPHFWIYWAVTVPLTLITLGVYFLWSNLKAMKEDEEDERTMKGKRQNTFGVNVQRRSRLARIFGLDLLARSKKKN